MDNKNDRDIRVENAKNELLEESNRIFSKYNLTNWGALEACAKIVTLQIAFNIKEHLTPKGQERRDELLNEILSAMKADIIDKLKD